MTYIVSSGALNSTHSLSHLSSQTYLYGYFIINKDFVPLLTDQSFMIKVISKKESNANDYFVPQS